MRARHDFAGLRRATVTRVSRWSALLTLPITLMPACETEPIGAPAADSATGGANSQVRSGGPLGGAPGRDGTAAGGSSTAGATPTGGAAPSTGGGLLESGSMATGGRTMGSATSDGPDAGSGDAPGANPSSTASGEADTGGATNDGAATGGGSVSVGGEPSEGESAPPGGDDASGSTPGGSSAAGGSDAATGSSGVVNGGGATPTGGAMVGGAAGDSAGGAAPGDGTTAVGPCDIYEAGETPCVAAHSTVRSLYGSYDGRLYQVRRLSDGATLDINAARPMGFADSAAQDDFCASSSCTISVIYDQSPQRNDLTLTEGGWIGDRAREADADGIRITVSGHPVYGVHVPQADGVTGVGYRNNEATGTAEGDEPESMYMVVNGRYYNDECCFDYGNAERNSLNNGNGTMEAIYFGNAPFWGTGEGDGPWVMGDFENGLFSGKGAGLNTNDKSIDFDYVTAMLKGKPHVWAIKTGNAQAGTLTTLYEGEYPNGGYDPMKKEGAIVLGTGGDNSFMAVGDFFEGVMTTGYASDAVDEAVQANVVAAGYGH